MNAGVDHPAVVAVCLLVAAGVREFVICAGARNSAFVAVLASLPEGVRVWHHFEERSAAFFALGRIRASGRPAAVCTTSGTAVAELLPAVIEAHYGQLPLVALSADRPRRFRGSGAPQAIEQAGIFGPYAHALDVEHERPVLSGWNRQEPLHLNVCLDEPGAEDLESLRQGGAGIGFSGEAEPEPGRMMAFQRGSLSAERLVLVGDLLPGQEEAAAAVALASGGLIWAEASSGLRDHPALQDRLLCGGEALLRRLTVRQVVRLGGVPTCRFWRDLEQRPDITVVNVGAGKRSGLARGSVVVPAWRGGLLPDLPTGDPAAVLAGDRALREEFRRLCREYPEAEPALVAALASAIPMGCPVLTGNSLAVREWNLAAPRGRGHRVHALRGANGIDGNVSAFFGIAAAVDEAWAVIGDLTALYDLAAPWILPQLPAGRRRLAVISNGGGAIFRRLPSLAGFTPREKAIMENPHELNFSGWASQWGMAWVEATPTWLASGAAEHLDAPAAVVELRPDAEATAVFWLAWERAAAQIVL
jgi:2-succinyl-5-enolpyruvyl-6-hydroxy-3-cyclohexene-1-carboxylate synthase